MNDAEEERLLRANLQVSALSPEALARIRQAAESEWRARVEAPPRRRGMRLAAVASVAVLAVAGAWGFLGSWNADAGETLARVARSDAPGVLEQHSLWREKRLDVGSDLKSGRHFEAQGATLLSLQGGGNLRIAHGSRFEVLSANSVRLESGEMYVDIPPGAHRDASFVAITDAGEFRHVGTQFEIAVNDGATRLRVREGSVRWHASDGDSTVDAGSEVEIDALRHVARRLIETSGAPWSWTESLAPDIEIENRPLGDFLDWFARETGRRLDIADDATKRRVTTIRMHGDIHGLEPSQALVAVLGSTSLRFQVSADAIRVSFAGESPTPSR
ncbi:MAG TPA: FecR domain-containing protein [Steroidobacteraceae bacterium]|jgi:ferric-dicitrate binding protein FerR (iron transport regulator)|nr:FecR domain-containing protein [Steroidobacteraceae bacterium]